MKQFDKELEDVRAFHKKMGFLTFEVPGHLSLRKLKERVECMQEELNEFKDAVEAQDLAAQADALVDLVYFVKGTALMLGLPWPELWNAVQQANMEKEPGEKIREGSLHKVDCIKPEGWEPPDIAGILLIHGYQPKFARREFLRDDTGAVIDEAQAFATAVIDQHYITYRFWELRQECITKALALASPHGKGSKSSDYNDGGISIVDYADTGIADRSVGFFPDIWKKTLRLKSLFAAGRTATIRHESVEDNLVDLMNYITFEYAVYTLVKELNKHAAH